MSRDKCKCGANEVGAYGIFLDATIWEGVGRDQCMHSVGYCGPDVEMLGDAQIEARALSRAFDLLELRAAVIEDQALRTFRVGRLETVRELRRAARWITSKPDLEAKPVDPPPSRRGFHEQSHYALNISNGTFLSADEIEARALNRAFDLCMIEGRMVDQYGDEFVQPEHSDMARAIVLDPPPSPRAV